MKVQRSANQFSKSREYLFVSGMFADSSKPVTYFSTVMTYSQAADDLTLVSDLPGNAAMDWSIEELYQRDIDWQRVDSQIEPFLRQKDSAQFFNSITVALLPSSDSKLRGMAECSWNPPGFDGSMGDGEVVDLGPITVHYFDQGVSRDKNEPMCGKIRWNKDEVAAVAIDGQHRLAAIKKLAKNRGRSKSSVPVLLIVLHDEIGSPSGMTSESSMKMTRQLFIDLNKHAKKVGRARQILLDDSDPVSLCTRCLVGDKLTDGIESLAHHRLPLTLVDWHSEQAKFETGPYLSTILGLDRMARMCLGIDPIDDPLNYEAIKKSIESIEKSVEVSLSDAKSRLKDCQNQATPFEFAVDNHNNELELIKDGFCNSWAPAVVEIFQTLRPYSDFIERRRDQQTCRRVFSAWWAAKSRPLSDRSGPAGDLLDQVKREISDLNERDVSAGAFEAAINVFNEFKTSYELAFTVVFQRALMKAIQRWQAIDMPAIDNGTDSGPFGPDDDGFDAPSLGERRRVKTKDFLERINGVASRWTEFYSVASVCESGRLRLWLGSFLRTDGGQTIDFTITAAERASDLLFVIGFTHLANQSREYGDDFEAFWDAVVNQHANNKDLRKCHQALSRLEKSVGNRIAESIDPDLADEKKDAEARRQIQARCFAVWEACR